MTISLFFIVSCLIGFILGVCQKGININIVHKSVDNSEVKYNESMTEYLPPEVQQYYQETKGQNVY